MSTITNTLRLGIGLPGDWIDTATSVSSSTQDGRTLSTVSLANSPEPSTSSFTAPVVTDASISWSSSINVTSVVEVLPQSTKTMVFWPADGDPNGVYTTILTNALLPPSLTSNTLGISTLSMQTIPISPSIQNSTTSSPISSPTIFSTSTTINIIPIPTTSNNLSTSTATNTGNVTPSPNTHTTTKSHSQHHSELHAYILAAIIVSTIFVLAIIHMALLCILRRKWPNHYAKPEKKCPIRISHRWIASRRPFAAIERRRRRNKEIRYRQKSYTTHGHHGRFKSLGGSGNIPPSICDTSGWIREKLLLEKERRNREERGFSGDGGYWIRRDVTGGQNGDITYQVG